MPQDPQISEKIFAEAQRAFSARRNTAQRAATINTIGRVATPQDVATEGEEIIRAIQSVAGSMDPSQMLQARPGLEQLAGIKRDLDTLPEAKATSENIASQAKAFEDSILGKATAPLIGMTGELAAIPENLFGSGSQVPGDLKERYRRQIQEDFGGGTGMELEQAATDPRIAKLLGEVSKSKVLKASAGRRTLDQSVINELVRLEMLALQAGMPEGTVINDTVRQMFESGGVYEPESMLNAILESVGSAGAFILGSAPLVKGAAGLTGRVSPALAQALGGAVPLAVGMAGYEGLAGRSPLGGGAMGLGMAGAKAALGPVGRMLEKTKLPGLAGIGRGLQGAPAATKAGVAATYPARTLREFMTLAAGGAASDLSQGQTPHSPLGLEPNQLAAEAVLAALFAMRGHAPPDRTRQPKAVPETPPEGSQAKPAPIIEKPWPKEAPPEKPTEPKVVDVEPVKPKPDQPRQPAEVPVKPEPKRGRPKPKEATEQLLKEGLEREIEQQSVGTFGELVQRFKRTGLTDNEAHQAAKKLLDQGIIEMPSAQGRQKRPRGGSQVVDEAQVVLGGRGGRQSVSETPDAPIRIGRSEKARKFWEKYRPTEDKAEPEKPKAEEPKPEPAKRPNFEQALAERSKAEAGKLEEGRLYGMEWEGTGKKPRASDLTTDMLRQAAELSRKALDDHAKGYGEGWPLGVGALVAKHNLEVARRALKEREGGKPKPEGPKDLAEKTRLQIERLRKKLLKVDRIQGKALKQKIAALEGRLKQIEEGTYTEKSAEEKSAARSEAAKKAAATRARRKVQREKIAQEKEAEKQWEESLPNMKLPELEREAEALLKEHKRLEALHGDNMHLRRSATRPIEAKLKKVWGLIGQITGGAERRRIKIRLKDKPKPEAKQPKETPDEVAFRLNEETERLQREYNELTPAAQQGDQKARARQKAIGQRFGEIIEEIRRNKEARKKAEQQQAPEQQAPERKPTPQDPIWDLRERFAEKKARTLDALRESLAEPRGDLEGGPQAGPRYKVPSIKVAKKLGVMNAQATKWLDDLVKEGKATRDSAGWYSLTPKGAATPAVPKPKETAQEAPREPEKPAEPSKTPAPANKKRPTQWTEARKQGWKIPDKGAGKRTQTSKLTDGSKRRTYEYDVERKDGKKFLVRIEKDANEKPPTKQEVWDAAQEQYARPEPQPVPAKQEAPPPSPPKPRTETLTPQEAKRREKEVSDALEPMKEATGFEYTDPEKTVRALKRYLLSPPNEFTPEVRESAIKEIAHRSNFPKGMTAMDRAYHAERALREAESLSKIWEGDDGRKRLQAIKEVMADRYGPRGAIEFDQFQKRLENEPRRSESSIDLDVWKKLDEGGEAGTPEHKTVWDLSNTKPGSKQRKATVKSMIDQGLASYMTDKDGITKLELTKKGRELFEDLLAYERGHGKHSKAPDDRLGWYSDPRQSYPEDVIWLGSGGGDIIRKILGPVLGADAATAQLDIASRDAESIRKIRPRRPWGLTFDRLVDWLPQTLPKIARMRYGVERIFGKWEKNLWKGGEVPEALLDPRNRFELPDAEYAARLEVETRIVDAIERGTVDALQGAEKAFAQRLSKVLGGARRYIVELYTYHVRDALRDARKYRTALDQVRIRSEFVPEIRRLVDVLDADGNRIPLGDHINYLVQTLDGRDLVYEFVKAKRQLNANEYRDFEVDTGIAESGEPVTFRVMGYGIQDYFPHIWTHMTDTPSSQEARHHVSKNPEAFLENAIDELYRSKAIPNERRERALANLKRRQKDNPGFTTDIRFVTSAYFGGLKRKIQHDTAHKIAAPELYGRRYRLGVRSQAEIDRTERFLKEQYGADWERHRPVTHMQTRLGKNGPVVPIPAAVREDLRSALTTNSTTQGRAADHSPGEWVVVETTATKGFKKALGAGGTHRRQLWRVVEKGDWAEHPKYPGVKFSTQLSGPEFKTWRGSWKQVGQQGSTDGMDVLVLRPLNVTSDASRHEAPHLILIGSNVPKLYATLTQGGLLRTPEGMQNIQNVLTRITELGTGMGGTEPYGWVRKLAKEAEEGNRLSGTALNVYRASGAVTRTIGRLMNAAMLGGFFGPPVFVNLAHQGYLNATRFHFKDFVAGQRAAYGAMRPKIVSSFFKHHVIHGLNAFEAFDAAAKEYPNAPWSKEWRNVYSKYPGQFSAIAEQDVAAWRTKLQSNPAIWTMIAERGGIDRMLKTRNGVKKLKKLILEHATNANYFGHNFSEAVIRMQYISSFVRAAKRAGGVQAEDGRWYSFAGSWGGDGTKQSPIRVNVWDAAWRSVEHNLFHYDRSLYPGLVRSRAWPILGNLQTTATLHFSESNRNWGSLKRATWDRWRTGKKVTQSDLFQIRRMLIGMGGLAVGAALFDELGLPSIKSYTGTTLPDHPAMRWNPITIKAPHFSQALENAWPSWLPLWEGSFMSPQQTMSSLPVTIMSSTLELGADVALRAAEGQPVVDAMGQSVDHWREKNRSLWTVGEGLGSIPPSMFTAFLSRSMLGRLAQMLWAEREDGLVIYDQPGRRVALKPWEAVWRSALPGTPQSMLAPSTTRQDLLREEIRREVKRDYARAAVKAKERGDMAEIRRIQQVARDMGLDMRRSLQEAVRGRLDTTLEKSITKSADVTTRMRQALRVLQTPAGRVRRNQILRKVFGTSRSTARKNARLLQRTEQGRKLLQELRDL